MSEAALPATSEGDTAIGDGLGAFSRGDLMIAVYAGDASMARSQWLFGYAERLMAKCPEGMVCLSIIPQSSKPPDAVLRAFERHWFDRVGQQLRRVVTLPEGNPFFVSIVRLVVGAHVAIQRRGDLFFFPKNLDDAIRVVHEAKTDATPGSAQIKRDLEALRAAMARNNPTRTSLRT